MSAQNITASIYNLVEPIVKPLGLYVWDVQYVKEGASMILRILIDKETGINIDDCEKVSKAIDKPLDDFNLINESYCLEVSSSGIERELTRPEHFEILKGRNIKIKTIKPLENEKVFNGKLISFIDGLITLDISGEQIVFVKNETEYVRLFDDENYNGGIMENE